MNFEILTVVVHKCTFETVKEKHFKKMNEIIAVLFTNHKSSDNYNSLTKQLKRLFKIHKEEKKVKKPKFSETEKISLRTKKNSCFYVTTRNFSRFARQPF